MKVIALIPAAGSGSRMRAKEKKPYLSLGDKPILAHTLSEFEQCSLINEVILIVSKDAIDYCKTSIVEAFKVKKVNKVIAGGPRRQDSVWEGLKILKDDCKLVMVHDGVRPFVSQEILKISVHETTNSGATVVAVPVKDTIKIVSKQAEVLETHCNKGGMLAILNEPALYYENELINKNSEFSDDNNYNLKFIDNDVLTMYYYSQDGFYKVHIEFWRNYLYKR